MKSMIDDRTIKIRFSIINTAPQDNDPSTGSAACHRSCGAVFVLEIKYGTNPDY